MPRNLGDYLIGYLGHYVSQDGAYYGGLLVTNLRGVPREFRHSEGVKPTKLQTMLYGESLEDSLGGDALGPALYDALETRPDLLVIGREGKDLFGRFAFGHRPAAMLVQYPDRDMAFGESLSEGGELLHPIEFSAKSDGAGYVHAYIEEDSSNPLGRSILDTASTCMNLVSPFNRIGEVLAEIAVTDHSRRRTS
jgi:hypothetical protein